MDNWTNWLLSIDGVDEEEEGAAMDVEDAAPVVVPSADIVVGESTSSSEDKSNPELKQKGRSLDETIDAGGPASEVNGSAVATGESTPKKKKKNTTRRRRSSGTSTTSAKSTATPATSSPTSRTPPPRLAKKKQTYVDLSEEEKEGDAAGDDVIAGGDPAPGDRVINGGGPAFEDNGGAVATGETTPKKKKKNTTRRRRNSAISTTSTNTTTTSATATSPTTPPRSGKKKRTLVDLKEEEKAEDLDLNGRTVGEDDKVGRVVLKEDGGEDDVEWLVEKITKKRITEAGTVEYRVQWIGWDSSYNTWEPPEHLTNSPLILAEFEQKEKEKNERKKRSRKKPCSASTDEAPAKRQLVPPPLPTSAMASSLLEAEPSFGAFQISLKDKSGQGHGKVGENKDKGDPVPSTSTAAAALLVGGELASASALPSHAPAQEKEKKYIWMNIQGHVLPVEKEDTDSEYCTDSEDEGADHEFVQDFMGPTFYRRWPKDKTPLAILGTNVTNNTRLIFVRLKPDNEAEAQEILKDPWEGMDLTNCIMVPTSGFRDLYPQMLIDFFRSGFTLKD